MYNNFRNSLFVLIAFVVVVSCRKSPDSMGLKTLPTEDLLGAEYVDTFTLVTHTVKDDSILIAYKGIFISPLLLGVMNDPVFGLSSASIYTQFSLSTVNPLWGPHPVLDSAVLSLAYYNKQYYGTLHPQKFTVYEVTNPIYKDSTYYSNSFLPYSTQLGSKYQIPVLGDSVVVGKEKFPCHLRMKLDEDFFQNFINSSDTTFYNSNSSFQTNVLKGVYITSSTAPYSGEGALLSMDLTNLYSRITLYYHNDNQDSLSYYFGISRTDCGRFSHFEHDYSLTADIKNQLNTASSKQEDKVFVQPMAGLRTEITIPSLMKLLDSGKVAINKAELILKVEPTSIRKYTYSPHPKLFVTIADSALGALTMSDDLFDVASYFGGSYDATNMEYRFNIPRYIQQVIDGKKKNTGIYIQTNLPRTLSPIIANRVQLVGGDRINLNRMRLKITYTSLNQK